MNVSSMNEVLNEVLFDDVGKKIQKMAIIVFLVDVVSCVVLAFCLGWERNNWGETEFRAGIFFAILIGGPLASYTSALILYGFGKLVDKISELHTVGASVDRDVPSIMAAVNTAPSPVRTVDRISDLIDNPNQKSGGNTWLCSCGRCNPNYMSSCVCGRNKYDQ